MAEAVFYHLTLRSLEIALPDLLQKTLAKGWRATVRCGSQERAEDLNRRLWTYDDASFLPHGTAADGSPERQPIYLSGGEETPNDPQLLFLVDGAGAAPEEIAGFERVCVMFDGRNPAAVATAREQWKAVVAAKIPAVYWAEEDGGRWVKKSEKQPEAT